MSSKQAKIEMLLELKNKMKTGLVKAKAQLKNNVTSMKRDLKNFKGTYSTVLKSIKGKLSSYKSQLLAVKLTHSKAFQGVRDEIPLLDKVFKLLKNPFTLITAGAIGLGALLGKATGKAADFNAEFLNIRQLNLDKSKTELNNYRELTLKTAFDVGLGAKQTSQAFYDIQSGTGLFGADVAKITKQVGLFSIATGAELPDAVNQTVKAMKAFGLKTEDVKGLLESNAKTVQVGITTFKELAQVQTEYAGAAAGAGQTVDTANKIFAAFTSIAKDSNTAATMTKSAFEGLTQKNTVKGLKEIGISLYDSKGQMRDLSGVLKEVSGKFKKMNPKEIDTLINKIGGPEGLRNMFVKLKTGSGDFFSTLEAYDSSKFNLDLALKNAHGDFNKLKEIVGNRLNYVMIRLGEKVLPIVLRAIEKFNNFITWTAKNFDTVKTVVGTTVAVIGTAVVIWKLWTKAQWLINTAMAANPIGLIIAGVATLAAGIVALVKRTEGWAKSWVAVKNILKLVWKQIKLDFSFAGEAIVDRLKILKLRFVQLGEYLTGFFSKIGKSFKHMLNGDFAKAKEALTTKITTKASVEIKNLENKRELAKQEYGQKTFENVKEILKEKEKISIKWKKKQPEKEEEGENSFFTPGSGGNKGGLPDSLGGPGTSGNDRVAAVVGSAKQARNITVNIEAMHKGNIDANKTFMQDMNGSDLEKWYSEMLMRVIRNAELSGG